MIGYNQACPSCPKPVAVVIFGQSVAKTNHLAVAKKANFFVHVSEMILNISDHMVAEMVIF